MNTLFDKDSDEKCLEVDTPTGVKRAKTSPFKVNVDDCINEDIDTDADAAFQIYVTSLQRTLMELAASVSPFTKRAKKGSPHFESKLPPKPATPRNLFKSMFSLSDSTTCDIKNINNESSTKMSPIQPISPKQLFSHQGTNGIYSPEDMETCGNYDTKPCHDLHSCGNTKSSTDSSSPETMVFFTPKAISPKSRVSNSENYASVHGVVANVFRKMRLAVSYVAGTDGDASNLPIRVESHQRLSPFMTLSEGSTDESNSLSLGDSTSPSNASQQHHCCFSSKYSSGKGMGINGNPRRSRHAYEGRSPPPTIAFRQTSMAEAPQKSFPGPRNPSSPVVVTFQSLEQYKRCCGDAQLLYKTPQRVPRATLNHCAAMEASPVDMNVDASAVVLAFENEEQFRTHFSADKTETMRDYLCLYTSDRNQYNHGHGPMYHQPVHGVSDNDIPCYFFKEFKFSDFKLKDGKIDVIRERLAAVSSAMKPFVDAAKSKADAANEQYTKLKWKLDAALKREKKKKREQRESSLPIEEQRFNYVFEKIQFSDFRHLTCSIGPTNGDFINSSLLELTKKMKHLGVSARDVVVDAGASYNGPAFCFAQYLGCAAYGIEVELQRNKIASRLCLQLLLEEVDIGLNRQVGYFPADLENLSRFLYATVYYAFDHVFSVCLALRNYRIAASNPKLWMIVTGKCGHEKALSRELTSLGFWCADDVSCSMSVSTESKKMYIWIRDKTKNPIPVGIVTPSKDDTMERNMERCLHMMLYEGDAARVKAYKDILNEAEMMSAEDKRRRKLTKANKGRYLDCRRAHYIQCQDECEACAKYFHHKEAQVYVKNSDIHGQGLFAVKNIAANSFLVPFRGEKIEILPKDLQEQRESWQIASNSWGSGYLLLKNGSGSPEFYQFVNHNCQDPTCVLVSFWDSNNKECFSLLTRRNVKQNEELSINYGHHFPKAFEGVCDCPSCLKVQKEKCVLLLAMKCGELGTRSTCDLVARGEWSKCDGRDTNRVMMMEKLDKSLVTFTVNKKRASANPRFGRHFELDFQSEDFVQEIAQQLRYTGYNPHGFFSMMIWDYIWNQKGWDVNGWGSAIYSKHLAKLAFLLADDGCVIMPVHVDILLYLVRFENSWSHMYHLSFIDEYNQTSNPLYRATLSLEDALLYGKTKKDAECSGISDEECRMICKAAPNSNTAKKLHQHISKELLAFRFVRLEKINSKMMDKRR